MSANAKKIPIRPITGYMDMRSMPEHVPVGGYRYVQNFSVEQKSKLCRTPGWTKLLDREDYNNFDLHDQLESLTGISGRRPITFMMQATSTTKARMLLAGTDRAIYTLSVGTGNWRILSDQLGKDGVTRWYGTQNGDVVILTNDYDPVQYWTFDAPPGEDSEQSVAPVSDLLELGISRVGVVVTWNNVTFYMNVVKDGTALPNKIYWSGYEKPLSLLPSLESIAGSADVDPQENILAALPIGNVLLVYTTRSIWEISVAGASATGPAFSVARRYNPSGSEACLAFKNSLVSTGDEHLYMAAEGIYSFSLFSSKPTLVEWINRASSIIYDEVDRARCDWQIAIYIPTRREIWYSWVKEGTLYPQRTLTLNTQYPFSTVIDHGFSAFGFFAPNEPFTTFGQWLVDNCICDSAEFSEEFGELIKEGGPCSDPESVTCESQPDSLFTTAEKELEDGIVMEDWDAEASEGSLCTILNGSLAELCIDETKRDECAAGALFVMASASDFCLKNLSDSYYREVCVGFTGCGTYALSGYKSILRSGPLGLKDDENEKLVTEFSAQGISVESSVPGQCAFRMGVSSMPLDPNDSACGIKWYVEDPQTLDCIAGASADHEDDQTRPDDRLSWPTYAQGHFIYYELTVENPDSNPVDTGAAVCLSSYTLQVQPVGFDY